MTDSSEKAYAALPLFDPRQGQVVLTPEAQGNGYWVGAPTVVHDAHGDRFLLCYRRRRPRGESSDRGYFAAIAESRDGVAFTDIWSVSKEELETTSIEKCCVLRCADGLYRYYLSYVDPGDQRWRVDVLEADSPAAFAVASRQEVFTAARATAAQALPVEGVKDPNMYLVGGVYYMLLSYAEGSPASSAKGKEMHATSDVYNTGILEAPTALAVSTDGLHFDWRGCCLAVGPDGAWDGYQARISSVLRRGPIWYGFYDGIATHEDNYEEKTGLVQSFDLRCWERVSPRAPLITSPDASGSVRYVEALPVGDEIWYYYEVARPDGSHELRRSVVSAL